MQKYNKFIVAGVGGIVQGLTIYFEVLPDWAKMLIALVTALGVYRVPNKQ